MGSEKFEEEKKQLMIQYATSAVKYGGGNVMGMYYWSAYNGLGH